MLGLRFKRLGIEWGAAHIEAQPTQIIINDVPIATISLSEGFGLEIELNTNQMDVTTSKEYIRIRVDNPS